MVYIRGIIVLFIYVVSISPNEKNKIKNNGPTIITVMSLLIIFNTSQVLMTKSNSIKIESSYVINNFFIVIIVLLISISSLIPPKVIIKTYRGIKSSK